MLPISAELSSNPLRVLALLRQTIPISHVSTVAGYQIENLRGRLVHTHPIPSTSHLTTSHHFSPDDKCDTDRVLNCPESVRPARTPRLPKLGTSEQWSTLTSPGRCRVSQPPQFSRQFVALHKPYEVSACTARSVG